MFIAVNQQSARLDNTHALSSSQLIDTFTRDYDISRVTVMCRVGLGLTDRVLVAAILLRVARGAVPAVDTDLGRPVTYVVPHTTVAVGLTMDAVTHSVRESLPREPTCVTPDSCLIMVIRI